VGHQNAASWRRSPHRSVTYGDPYGLKVCYKGTRSQVQRLKSGTEEATGTSITLDTDNCISALEMPKSDHALSPLAWRLAHLAFMIDDHKVEVGFGTRPNGGALRQSYAWVENPQYPAGRKGVTIRRRVWGGRLQSSRSVWHVPSVRQSHANPWLSDRARTARSQLRTESQRFPRCKRRAVRHGSRQHL
jgi:hypothetical protein